VLVIELTALYRLSMALPLSCITSPYDLKTKQWKNSAQPWLIYFMCPRVHRLTLSHMFFIYVAKFINWPSRKKGSSIPSILFLPSTLRQPAYSTLKCRPTSTSMF
jgi:hypothetical protein